MVACLWSAVRGALVCDHGNMTWPPPPPPAPSPAAVQAQQEAAKAAEAKLNEVANAGPKDKFGEQLSSSATTAVAAALALAMSSAVSSSAFTAMLSKFVLASICGYQTVLGVTAALHR